MLLYFGSVMIIAQLLSILAFDFISVRNANELIQKDLQGKSLQFRNLIDDRFRNLRENSVLLLGDFAFKTAVATKEEATVRSALLNQQSRVESNFMAVINPKESFLVTTLSSANKDQLADLIAPLIYKHEQKQVPQTGMITYQNHVYQIVVLPVKAPRTIAYLITGFLVDSPLAHSWARVLGADLIFVSMQPTQQIISSSNSSSIVYPFAASKYDFNVKSLHDIILKEQQQHVDKTKNTVTRIIKVHKSYTGETYYGVLQKSWLSLFAEYTKFRPYLWLLAGIFLSLMTIVVYYLSSHLAEFQTHDKETKSGK